MSLAAGTYALELGFAAASQAAPDPDRPPLLRARARDVTPYGGEDVELHVCDATDLLHDDSVQTDLFTFGFDRVDLSRIEGLQPTLADVLAAGEMSDDHAASIRGALDGAVLSCTSGRHLKVRYVADEGMFVRTGGPNGLPLVDRHSKGANGHSPARSVHTDQDVHGTPMVQLMDGRAPTLFRHDSPDGHNHDASLMLVNLWIPLRQVTQPLVIADGRSVDRLHHQLLYQLATDSFLDRDENQTVNDIWTYLHHPDQRWYFCSEMDHRSGYVFDTLSAPHSSATLPGEDVAERCFVALQACEAEVGAGDAAALREVVNELGHIDVPEHAPTALAQAIREMTSVLDEARADVDGVCGDRSEAWKSRSEAARRRVVRQSIEMRLVVSTEASGL
jgi:hypothetical protein